jgi:hypothetical protein
MPPLKPASRRFAITRALGPGRGDAPTTAIALGSSKARNALIE